MEINLCEFATETKKWIPRKLFLENRHFLSQSDHPQKCICHKVSPKKLLLLYLFLVAVSHFTLPKNFPSFSSYWKNWKYHGAQPFKLVCSVNTGLTSWRKNTGILHKQDKKPKVSTNKWLTILSYRLG